MKRAFKAYVGICLLVASYVSAYHGEDDDPFSIDAYGIAVAHQKVLREGDGEFVTDCVGGTKVQFGEAHIGLTYHYLCSGCCEEYLIGAGYTYTRLKWGENPFFRQQNFNTATLDLGAYWGCICDWDFRALTRINLDTDEPNPSHYLFFDFTVWGRLQHKPNIGINVGALIFTGMKVNRGYPIFGIDWKPFDFLEINLVYPTNMSVVYYITPAFKASVGGRLIYSRHRVREQDKYEDFSTSNTQFLDLSHATQYFSNGQPFSIPVVSDFPPDCFPMYLNPRWFAKAVWEYRAWGIEGALDYQCGLIEVNVHAGWSFWNRLTIGAHSFNHKQSYKLENAPYIGANLLLRF